MRKHGLGTILEELHRESYLWARQCCGFDEDQAKDVLQSVYLKILEGKAVYREKSSFKTWLFSVIRYTSLEEKKSGKKTASLEEVSGFAAREESPPGDFHEELIKILPKRQQEVLLLVFYHNLTLEKTAEIMRISLGSVRTHYDRGKKNLKALIIKKKLQENV